MANEQGLRSLGAEIDQAHKSAQSPRRRRAKWIVGTIGVIVVVLVASVAGYAWYLDSELHKVSVNGLSCIVGHWG